MGFLGIFAKIMGQMAQEAVSADAQRRYNRDSGKVVEKDQFRGKLSLTDVIIPEGVTQIGLNAFRECPNLTSVHFPSTLKRIQADAFNGCKALEEIVFPEGVKCIGSGAFRDCTNLSSVRFPPSSTLEEIGGNAFTGCTSLKEVVVPEGVKKIGNGAFYKCSSLERAVLPQSLKEINGGIFYDCKSLKEVEMPRYIRGDFSNVFPHCESLTEFAIPHGADELGAFTFQYCEALEKLTIPNTVKSIGHRSVMHCDSLKEIFIPDSVEKIACLHTFYHCHSLEKIRLPLSFEFYEILDDDHEDKAAVCFNDCPMLHTVEMCGREFRVEKVTDTALTLIRAELAADGDRAAKFLVLHDLPRVFHALVDENRIELTEKLLSRIPADLVKPDDMLTAVDYAAMTGAHEIYVMLVQFKNGSAPSDESTEIQRRFEL